MFVLQARGLGPPEAAEADVAAEMVDSDEPRRSHELEVSGGAATWFRFGLV